MLPQEDLGETREDCGNYSQKTRFKIGSALGKTACIFEKRVVL